jgi:hypothetical protein
MCLKKWFSKTSNNINFLAFVKRLFLRKPRTVIGLFAAGQSA